MLLEPVLKTSVQPRRIALEKRKKVDTNLRVGMESRLAPLQRADMIITGGAALPARRVLLLCWSDARSHTLSGSRSGPAPWQGWRGNEREMGSPLHTTLLYLHLKGAACELIREQTERKKKRESAVDPVLCTEASKLNMSCDVWLPISR